MSKIQCDAMMYHMKTVTLRDLRYHFPKVERLLRQGETVDVTRRGKVFATLSPKAEHVPGHAPLPDFMARLRAIYGDTPLEIPGSEIVSEGRDRF